MNDEIAVGPPARPPWWQTPWVAIPAVAVGGGLGVLAAVAVERLRAKPGPEAPCPLAEGDELWADHGRLEDVDYLEIRTEGASEDEELPMVIALLTRGMRPDRMEEISLGIPVRARVIIPTGFYDAGLGRSWTRAQQDQPQYAQELEDSANELIPFIESLVRCRPTVHRPVVAGYSGGADLAYALAAEAPEHIRAAVGAAGWLPPAFGPVKTPTTVIHGKQDKAVPYERTAAEVAQRVAKRQPMTLVPMEGVDHSFAGALQLKWLGEVAKTLPSPTQA